MTTRSTLRRLTHLALAATLLASTGFAVAQRDDNHGNDHRQGNNQQQNRPDFHFQDQHRNNFQQHYAGDANKWRENNHRAHFEAGQAIPRNYAIRAVPSSYYRGAPAPPAGYRYGYYQGYVVAYNPTSRIIADVLDLATGH
jgi:Ni/Co efflux regulator RcnB